MSTIASDTRAGVPVVRWRDERRRSQCPLCGSAGDKSVVLSVAGRAGPGLHDGGKALLHCPDCDVRYADPLTGIDYAVTSALSDASIKFYVEQGAGIDPMLDPLNLADARAVSRYVEIGCGFGFSLDYARSMLGWEVRGYDPGGPAAAGKTALGVSIENVYLDRGNIEPGSADLIYCSEVIEHIAKPDGFIDLLGTMLAAGGQLLLTTPNAAAIARSTPREVLWPLLSPGHHLILYSGAALAALLRRHGFPYLRIDDASHQLRVAASRAPFHGAADHFTRERYRAYLAAAVEKHGLDTLVGFGFGARLLKECVNFADYTAGRAIGAQLRDAVQRRYAIDLDALDAADIPILEQTSFEQLGAAWPYNLCGLMFFRGVLAMAKGANAVAGRAFRAARAFGVTLRAALNAIGADDGETAVLIREAEIAELAVLARDDPQEAVRAFETIAAREIEADDGAAAAHRERVRRRLFTDLTSLGNLAEAERVAGNRPGLDADLCSGEGIDAAFAWGVYLLNRPKDYPAALALFERLDATCREPGGARPHLRWPARFHLALAARLAGEHGKAAAAADEILAAAADPAPPPADLVARARELRGG